MSRAACGDFGHRQRGAAAAAAAAVRTANVVRDHVISAGLGRDTVGTKGTFSYHFSKSRK